MAPKRALEELEESRVDDKRFSDLEILSASPLAAALAANEYANESVKLDRPFKPHVLTLRDMCVQVVLTVWRHSDFGRATSGRLSLVTVLKTRADQAEAAAESATGSSGDAEIDFLAGARRHGPGFGRGRWAGGFDDESISRQSAQFGGSARRPRSRHAVDPDVGTLESVIAMGFP